MMMLRKRPNPNRNLLRGMRCPRCGDYGGFVITVTAEVTVTDQAYEEIDTQANWNDHSPCRCKACGHSAQVVNFKAIV